MVFKLFSLVSGPSIEKKIFSEPTPIELNVKKFPTQGPVVSRKSEFENPGSKIIRNTLSLK